LLLSLLWTGWPTPKPEIICKMEREEMQCMPDPLSAQQMHQTPFAGGYEGGPYSGVRGSCSTVPLALDAPCPAAGMGGSSAVPWCRELLTISCVLQAGRVGGWLGACTSSHGEASHIVSCH